MRGPGKRVLPEAHQTDSIFLLYPYKARVATKNIFGKHMASSALRPALVVADQEGNIYDHPELLMVCRQGEGIFLPRPAELIPLPENATFFMLPGRSAIGFNSETGELEVLEDLPVAACIFSPYLVTGHPACVAEENAQGLPSRFAYGAVGFANGRFYVCAKKMETKFSLSQVTFSGRSLEKKVRPLLEAYPENRLIRHVAGACALIHGCPAAESFFSGRGPAPLPVSIAANSRGLGCPSCEKSGSSYSVHAGKKLSFSPSAREIVAYMQCYASRQSAVPVFFAGTGCEGEPLTQGALLAEAIEKFRAASGKGKYFIRTNGSLPDAVADLANAAVTGFQIVCNSVTEELYTRYFEPKGYFLSDVIESIHRAEERNIPVALELIYFPGITDTEMEVEALIGLLAGSKIRALQLRSLCGDPQEYVAAMQGISTGPCIGYSNFIKRLRKANPDLRISGFSVASLGADNDEI